MRFSRPRSLGFEAASRVLGNLASFVPSPGILDGTQEWGVYQKNLPANSRKQLESHLVASLTLRVLTWEEEGRVESLAGKKNK